MFVVGCQAQTTLINFTVTRDGLEDQLLADVVAKERPDLEKLKADLTRQQNEFKITLKQLEDNLLARLSAAEGNFLGDYALVENLETTKRTAIEIEEKVKEAKVTEVKINDARELYRPASARASLLYFILNDLNVIHPLYVFSLKVCRQPLLSLCFPAKCFSTTGHKLAFKIRTHFSEVIIPFRPLILTRRPTPS